MVAVMIAHRDIKFGRLFLCPAKENYRHTLFISMCFGCYSKYRRLVSSFSGRRLFSRHFTVENIILFVYNGTQVASLSEDWLGRWT